MEILMLPNPIFWNIHMYGVMIAVGVLCCFLSLFYLTKKLKVDQRFTDFIYYNGIASIALGFGSATLFQSFYNYLANPEAGFKLGGMTFIGGLIGGVATFLIVYAFFWKKYDTTLFDVLSIIPCPILIAHAFGRIGCFCAGCCYGKETDSIFGIKFPGMSTPVHPTMLYEAIFLFFLFAVCSFLLLKWNFKHNLSVYLIAYGIFRFLIEFIRDDDRGAFIGSLTPSQFWSLLMVIFGIGLIFLMNYILKKNNESWIELKQKEK